MDVFTELTSYPEDPPRFFDFSRFKEDAGDFVLIPGRIDFKQLGRLKGRRAVYLEFEEPNRFLVEDPNFHHLDHEEELWRVFTICPYTAAWLNARQGSQKRTAVFFPFNEAYAPPPTAKEFDVVYTGQIVAPQIQDIVAAISHFDYRLVSYSRMADARVTHVDATYVEKLDVISRARATVVANLLYPGAEHIKTLSHVPGYEDNEAFRLVHAPFWKRKRSVVMPQLKSRLFEAAFCGSLILCQRDAFNVVERFFTPDVEFVYYEEGKLEQALDAVLNHYDRYVPVIDRARARAMRDYTTYAFFKRFLRPL